MREKAFTLIELMVVIAIIGVLSSVLAPQIFKQINKGKVAAAVSFVNALKTAAFSYYSDTEQWPADGSTGTACLTATSQGTCPSGWSGPYIDRWPSAGPWSGSTYSWSSANGAGGGLFGSGAVRVVALAAGSSTLTNSDIQEIDKKIDGSVDNSAGAVRYSSGATTAYLLISAN